MNGPSDTVVVAIGGNALLAAGEPGTYEEQAANAAVLAEAFRDMLRGGFRLVITHGNGPQVGNLAIQQEEAAHLVPAQPLFVLGAMTQGQIGSMLATALAGDGSPPVASILTHVVVDARDPAFTTPTKPIGPFFAHDEAARLARERGWQVAEDAGRGWRRVVASPEPQSILEAAAVRSLVDAGYLTIASGGGGIPVLRDGPAIRGVDAVIDKDLSAFLLAKSVEADFLVMLTGVPRVSLGYGTPAARELDSMTVDEAQAYQAAGEFPAGSMGPKVAAAVRFVRSGGRGAVITSLEFAREALSGRAGTRIVSGEGAALERQAG